MIQLLGIFLFCCLLQGPIFAAKHHSHGRKNHYQTCCPGPTGPQGLTGQAGNPGPDFGEFACLFNNEGQVLTTGQNVLFQNTISLAGITYDGTTGVLTLQPGTYSVTYFSNPSGNLNLVVNGAVVPNAPLSGTATILTLSNASNTLVLQAQANVNLPAASENQCSAMITVYRIN